MESGLPPRFGDQFTWHMAIPLRLKLPYLMPSAPPNVHYYVGQVILAWGLLEELVNNIIIALSCANGTTLEAGWKYKSLKERRKYFGREVSKTLSGCDWAIPYFHTTVDEAISLQWKRNLLAHGRTLTSILKTDKGVVAHLTATGVQNRQEVSLTLSSTEIEDLFCEIAHLCGKLSAPFDPRCPLGWAPEHDRLVIKEFVRTHPLVHPKPEIPA
jgi:hypothetical protein